MKKTLLFIVVLSNSFGFAQSRLDLIKSHFAQTAVNSKNLKSTDLKDLVIQSEIHDQKNKVTHYYVTQTMGGIPIYNAFGNITFKADDVVHSASNFINIATSKINSKLISSDRSKNVQDLSTNLIQVFEALGIDNKIVDAIAVDDTPNSYRIKTSALKNKDAFGQLVYHKNADNELLLSWHFEFYSPDSKHLWHLNWDVTNKKIVAISDLMVSCSFDHDHSQETTPIGTAKQAMSQPSIWNENNNLAAEVSGYRVFKYTLPSPIFGDRTVETSPANAIASPYGWHDTNGRDGAEYTITRGNNVFAYEDTNDMDEPGYSPDGGAALRFDFPYNGIRTYPDSYVDASVTNLFYMNNMMHDIFYHFGFDEQSGNFQYNQYGKLTGNGATDDEVYAEAQDGGGTNNANFGTPRDGYNPAMQMYMWYLNQSVNFFKINAPAAIAGYVTSLENGFTPGNVNIPLAPGITANIVLATDAVGDVNDGCTAFTNASAMANKIALIKRGNCNFTEKVINAQNAGALAVVIMDNVAGNLSTMGGGDANVRIPAINITMASGNTIINSLNQGNAVSATIEIPQGTIIGADGDFDNGIIAHEYGHGISSRLTGGRLNSGCLNSSEQMGEGWSDFFALILGMKATDTSTTSRGIGNFVAFQSTTGRGIRQYPYNTSRSVNPLTYASTNGYFYTSNGQEVINVHAVGTVWATILWDLTWKYVDKYGFNADLINGNGGNQKVLQLVVDGLKLQPCNPSFVSGRDALLAADRISTGGQNACLIWEAFAGRGVGEFASEGLNTGTAGIKDQIQDFTVPSQYATCDSLSVANTNQQRAFKMFPNPTENEVTFEIPNYNKPVQVDLFDLNGRKVYAKYFEDFMGYKTMDLPFIQTGIYIVKFNGEGLDLSKKLIIKK
ncbi:MAG: T9SS-dependent M36 family metallopeptidase [Flavobacterium sp.]|nr:T9SS-dependent M36 family metallopeptidase [Candidatus Neoflavobacterium equi]